MRPPVVAERLLRIVTSKADRRYLLADLAEEFDRLAAQRGRRAAARWYWHQTLTSVRPLTSERASRWMREMSAVRWSPTASANDLTQAARWIRRHPSTSLTVFITMSVALAVALAASRIIYDVVLRPLPLPSPHEIVNVRVTGPTLSRAVRASSFPDFEDWRAGAQWASALSAWTPATYRMTERGEPREIPAVRVAPDFDRVFGLRVLYGRSFQSGDFSSERPQVVILAHDFWKTEFGGDGLAVGRTITLDGRPHEIVGVLPELDMSMPEGRQSLWIPLVPQRRAFWENARGTGWLSVVARIREGVSRRQAEAALTAQARNLATIYPDTNREKTDAELEPLSQEILGPVEPILTMLGAALSAVVLIACGNVANLLLAAGARRRREFAVRAAMGAPEFRLARQLAFEATLMCVAAAAAAVALAPALVRMFLAIYPTTLPRTVGTNLNVVTIANAAALAVIGSTLLAVPLIVQGTRRGMRIETGGAFRSTEGRRERSLRAALVAAQVALSFTLIVAGISFVRTLGRLHQVDTGYRTDGVMTFVVNPPPNATSGASGLEFYDRVVEEVRGVPGVRDVAAAVAVPMTTSSWRFGIRPAGSRSAVLVSVNMTTSAYFDALGIRLREGRLLTAEEQRHGARVAVVNEQLAGLLGGNMVGRRIDYSGTAWDVVGVVQGTRHVHPRDEPMPELFIPWHNAGRRPQAIVVRADIDPLRLLPAIAARVRAVDPTAPLTDVARLDDRLRTGVAAERFRATLLGSLAVIAIALAALGAYSVTAYSVAQRTREYGIRLALGERPSSIWWRAAGAAAAPAAFGVIAGGMISLGGSRWLESFLYQVSARDPGVISGTGASLLALALLSAAWSATRAARVDPVRTLSHD
jgi:putative ABC transport system permease protein